MTMTMTAVMRQDDALQLSTSMRNAQRPLRHSQQHPLLKTKSLPSLPQLRELLDTSLHVIQRGDHDDDEESLSSLEDPDDAPPKKKDPKLLLSRTQKVSLDNSDSHLSLIGSTNNNHNNDAPVKPHRKRSHKRNDDDVNTAAAVARLQKLSMSAPNLRFNLSSLHCDDDDNDDDAVDADNETHNKSNITVTTPTRRRNPDYDDRGSKSPRSVDSQQGQPRVLLSHEQARSTTGPRRARRAKSSSSDGCDTTTTGSLRRRMTRIKVRALSIDSDDAVVVATTNAAAAEVCCDSEDDDNTPSKDGDNNHKMRLKRAGSSKRQNSLLVRRPLVRSDSKTKTSTSPFRARLQISRQKLIEKLTDAGVAKDQHEEMMVKMGFAHDYSEFNQSAEF